MRIALLTANYQPASVRCGVGDYTRCLRAALEAQGHPCAVITSARTTSQEGAIHRVSGRWGVGDAAGAWRALALVRPDAVIFQYTPEHYGFGPAFKVLPLACRWLPSHPLVLVTLHTLVGGRWIAKPYAALLAASCHGVISTNAELSDLFRRRLRPWRGRLHQIPIGANIPAPRLAPGPARAALHRRLGLPPEAAVLATFGFPAPGKGLETLLEALRLLDDGPGTHLACIGETRQEDRAYRADLERLARRLGVATRVHWLGDPPGAEVADLLAGADAFVVPYDDGASLRRGTLMAGFRAGAPVVTTTPRYPDPVLRPGETLVAVPPRSPADLAAALRKLLDDPGEADRLRRMARAAGEQFDWDAIAAEHVRFLEALRRRGSRA